MAIPISICTCNGSTHPFSVTSLHNAQWMQLLIHLMYRATTHTRTLSSTHSNAHTDNFVPRPNEWPTWTVFCPLWSVHGNKLVKSSHFSYPNPFLRLFINIALYISAGQATMSERLAVANHPTQPVQLCKPAKHFTVTAVGRSGRQKGNLSYLGEWVTSYNAVSALLRLNKCTNGNGMVGNTEGVMVVVRIVIVIGNEIQLLNY